VEKIWTVLAAAEEIEAAQWGPRFGWRATRPSGVSAEIEE